MLDILYAHTNFMTPLTFMLFKGDEGGDRRCFDDGEGLYLPSSILGPQEVNAELVFQPALLDVCRQAAHPHGPAARCHLLGETPPLLWAGRLSTGSCHSSDLDTINRRLFQWNSSFDCQVSGIHMEKRRKLRCFSNNNLFQIKRILVPIVRVSSFSSLCSIKKVFYSMRIVVITHKKYDFG